MSTDTPPKKIAIVGGGISSIITAFELSATPALRAQYQITLYQMGWRLGGKLASGENPAIGNRNEEHGLHVWFGFYDNAFFEINQCYQEFVKLQPAARYQSYLDAFKPNDYTPIGHTNDDGSYGFWDFTWPVRPGTPGVYVAPPRPLLILGELVAWLRRGVRNSCDITKLVSIGIGDVISSAEGAFLNLLARVEGSVKPPALPHANWIEDSFQHVIDWLTQIDQMEASLAYQEIAPLDAFLARFKIGLVGALHVLGLRTPDDHPIISAIELIFTTIRGLLNPKYNWLASFNLNIFDDYDLRAWMLENGGNPTVVNQSSFMRALYDIPFEYEHGDLSKPNFAAGAAMRWAIRTALTYRGHAMYEPQCGFGEAVIAPYYEVLKARGVTFKFFHKLVESTTTPDKSSLQSLRFAVQATAINGTYEPVTFSNGLYHWPIEPHWDQLVDGTKAKAAGADFESQWNAYPPVGEVTLQNGVDFDHVIIGLAGGVWKRLNAEDKPPVASLLDANPEFDAMASSLGLVATTGVQFWFTKPVTSLGWKARPATIGGAEPLDVWADMSQVLATEGWQPQDPPPQSLHYLCGPLNTTLFATPSSDTTVPAKADAIMHKLTQDWLEKSGTGEWPGAADADGSFDWSVLYDQSNAAGSQRLKAQFLRANVTPTECCGASHAGTTRHRVRSDRMLFTNVSIVGADTETGINVTCVEGATISGRRAARAICGSPQFIPNEDFMSGPFPPAPIA